MTRSVEIPEEGGLRGLYNDTRTLSIRGSINHEVAIKLGDEETFFTWAADLLAAVTQAAIEADSLPSVHPRHHDHINACDAADCDVCNSPALPYLAPAGDGGLREALEQTAREKIAEWYGAEWDASEDKFYETYDGGGISCVDDEAMLELRGVRLALDLALVAQPAAPAVPQPVDREALAKALRACTCASLPRPTCPLHGDEYARADAVLAVLAGEQEQVQ